ncbi:MAG: zinc ABC transporter substrate-binding protein, partial [Anaerolineaceae bacterium]
AIREYNVKAILVGNTVNPSLARRVADDTGTQLVEFYTGSLSAPGGPASTYIDYMHYNVNAIVIALD